MKVSCIECKEDFEAVRSSAKFCSAKCRVKWNSKSQSEGISDSCSTEIELSVNGEPTLVSKKPKTPTISKKLGEIFAKINDDFGEGTIMSLDGKSNMAVEAISTGSLGLDMALGVGGLPRGRIIEIYGPESSGKTTVATHVIAEAQKKGLKCAIVDAEHAFDPVYAGNIGVNIDDLIISQPDYGEQALEVADRLVLSGEMGVVVIDSVAALVPKAELEGEMGDSKMGLHARLMSQALRKMTASVNRTNTICIFINQLRQKIGVVYGPTETQPGGNALKFFSSVRLDIRRTAQIKDGETPIGNKVTVKVIKNKVAPPFKTAEFDIIFGEGISKAGELIDVGLLQGIIKKSGSWFSYNGENIGQGRESVKALLLSNPELAKEIEGKILVNLKK